MAKKREGFTLIELMVVMAIIAVLAVLMIGAIQLARSTASETIHRSNSKSMQTLLEGNYARYRRYCGTATSTPAKATGELTCLTSPATAPIFNYNGTTAGLVTLTDACAATATIRGGAKLTALTETGYTITPYDAKCVDNAANQMTADVITGGY